MKRGEIYLADLAPRSGSEQQGRRPVLVVSRDSFNRTPTWRSVIVVPISSSGSKTQRGPTVVELKKGQGGLKKDSLALCHQVTTLDRSKITTPLGDLEKTLLEQVDRGLKAALDLP